MNDKQVEQAFHTPNNIHSDVDVEALEEQIWNDLQGRVSREAIQQALLEILLKYEDVPVRIYVPIFVRQEALEMLCIKN
jgi:hypothetical protein